MNIAIVFASLSGNTEIIATDLYSFLNTTFVHVDLHNLQHIQADELKKYDLVFFGCSTWGDGDLNLVLDIFFSDVELASHDCSGAKFAVFSLGDSLYSQFARAGELVEKKLTELGGIIVSPHIKIDGYPSEEHFDAIHTWALHVIKNMSNIERRTRLT
jgi:flavodoxin I